MELLKLSKFKIQLQALATEFRHLRDRENSAAQQCQFLIQKQKQTEEEYGRKLQELQSELASSHESRLKLERSVSHLQNDNALLESRQRELQETIQNLLQSKENFINAYEESTCEMKRSIKAKDQKLTVLSEKLNSHLSLIDSIEKESISIKQLMNNVQSLVSEKEEVVAGLRSKMDKVSFFEKVFIEKVFDLENKLRNNEDELQKRDRIISELEAQLEVAKIKNNYQAQIEELQKTLSAKDAVIDNLISEKEALHCEAGNLAMILQKVKETFASMDEQERRVFSPALKCQQDNDMVGTNEDYRIEDVQNSKEASAKKGYRINARENQASPKCQEQKSIGNPHLENNSNVGSCLSESLYSDFQSAANGPSIPENNEKVHCLPMIQNDSECSTTQGEPSDKPWS
ncbi:protein GRIP isoform X2 [Euphorbia lathyris]|uniref:protein GRIP isoform X2 n=1 Tax=Euphorbia lathyris TaxID=212925 RepID=UPI0033133BF9